SLWGRYVSTVWWAGPATLWGRGSGRDGAPSRPSSPTSCRGPPHLVTVPGGRFVLVVGFPTGALQANCYLLAAGEGEPCVIVDPGEAATEPIADAVRQHRLSPVAVLLTHGHFDHCFSVAPVCDGNDMPAWIHPDDRALLS